MLALTGSGNGERCAAFLVGKKTSNKSKEGMQRGRERGGRKGGREGRREGEERAAGNLTLKVQSLLARTLWQ